MWEVMLGLAQVEEKPSGGCDPAPDGYKLSNNP